MISIKYNSLFLEYTSARQTCGYCFSGAHGCRTFNIIVISSGLNLNIGETGLLDPIQYNVITIIDDSCKL